MTQASSIVTKELAINVRAQSIGIVFEAHRGKNVQLDQITKDAAVIEKFLWSGFAPIEQPATPLTTIQEAANAAKDHLRSYLENSADIDTAKVEHALATLERFFADVEDALGFKL